MSSDRSVGSSARVTVVQADLSRDDDQAAVLTLTCQYAEDRMGAGRPLPAEVQARLIPELRRHPTTLIFLAYVDGAIAGIATCFVGFSTFAARPLINIHDLSVSPEFRGLGLARHLLEAVEEEARARGCAKLTLEVLETNNRARSVYQSAGFETPAAGEPGRMLFLSKSL